MYRTPQQKYYGLETSRSTLKYTLKQRLKLDKILERLNKSLLDNNLLYKSGPYSRYDIRVMLSNISAELGVKDIDILIDKLNERLHKINYNLPKKV